MSVALAVIVILLAVGFVAEQNRNRKARCSRTQAWRRFWDMEMADRQRREQQR